MVFFLQALPNTQNKIQGKQLMSVTDVPTTVLKLVIGRSTNFTVYLTPAKGKINKQSWFLSGDTKLTDPAYPPQTQDTLTLAALTAACCHVNKHTHTDIQGRVKSCGTWRGAVFAKKRQGRKKNQSY